MAGRRYTAPTGAGSGPMMVRRAQPPAHRPRSGIQVIERAEQEAGYEAQPREPEPPPLTVRGGVGISGGVIYESAINDQHDSTLSKTEDDSTLSNGSGADTGQHVVKPTVGREPSPTCMFCDNTEASDTLIPGFADGGRDYMVCGACVDRLIDAMRQELPRRRLRLAMERLAAGPVSAETLATIERLALQPTDGQPTEDKIGG